MKKEDLFREIGEIDEDLVEEAAEIEPQRRAQASQNGLKDGESPEPVENEEEKVIKLRYKKYRDIIGMAAACFVLVYLVGNMGLFSGGAKEAETAAGMPETTAAAAGTTAAAAETTAAAEEWMKDETLEAVPGEGLETTAAASKETGPVNETGTSGETHAETTVTTAAPIDWGELSIPERYPEIIWKSMIYEVVNYTLPEEEIAEKIGEITVSTTYLGETYESKVEIWSIHGFEEEYALAARFENTTAYFGIVNQAYGETPWEEY